MTAKTYQYGVNSEERAIQFLIDADYEILASRFKTKFGEIDIVAKKGDLVAFVEVKARHNQRDIEMMLRPKQIKRIKDAALCFIAKNPQFTNYNFRFDFMVFLDSKQPQHYEGFFE